MDITNGRVHLIFTIYQKLSIAFNYQFSQFSERGFMYKKCTKLSFSCTLCLFTNNYPFIFS